MPDYRPPELFKGQFLNIGDFLVFSEAAESIGHQRNQPSVTIMCNILTPNIKYEWD